MKINDAHANGSDQETSDVYLDHRLDKLGLNTEGARTTGSWERLCVVKLAGA